MTDRVAMAQRVLDVAKELSDAVRGQQDEITVENSDRIVEICKEAAGWIMGVRMMLEVE